MYKFKQDLASAYFPDNSKETASKRFAHEIHSNKRIKLKLKMSPVQYRTHFCRQIN